MFVQTGSSESYESFCFAKQKRNEFLIYTNYCFRELEREKCSVTSAMHSERLYLD